MSGDRWGVGWRKMEEGIILTLFTNSVWLFCPQHHTGCHERDRWGVGWREIEEGIMLTLFTTDMGLSCPQHYRSRERDRWGVGWRHMEEGIMLTLFTTGVWLFCPQHHSPSWERVIEMLGQTYSTVLRWSLLYKVLFTVYETLPWLVFCTFIFVGTLSQYLDFWS